MKKLMMAAAIVCAAAGVQAATVVWKTDSTIKGIKADTVEAGLSDGSYTADGLVVTAPAWQTYGSGELSYLLTLTYDLGSGEVVHKFGTEIDGSTLSKGVGLGNTAKIDSTVTDALFDHKGQAYHWDLVLTETGVDGAGNAFTMKSTLGNDAEVQSNGDIFLNTTVPASWNVTVASVPEPTSGLLLLLGVAGMALRRRRA